MRINTTYEVAMCVLGAAEKRCAEWKANNRDCFKCPMRLPGAGCAVKSFKNAADAGVPNGYWAVQEKIGKIKRRG